MTHRPLPTRRRSGLSIQRILEVIPLVQRWIYHSTIANFFATALITYITRDIFPISDSFAKFSRTTREMSQRTHFSWMPLFTYRSRNFTILHCLDTFSIPPISPNVKKSDTGKSESVKLRLWDHEMRQDGGTEIITGHRLHSAKTLERRHFDILEPFERMNSGPRHIRREIGARAVRAAGQPSGAWKKSPNLAGWKTRRCRTAVTANVPGRQFRRTWRFGESTINRATRYVRIVPGILASRGIRAPCRERIPRAGSLDSPPRLQRPCRNEASRSTVIRSACDSRSSRGTAGQLQCIREATFLREPTSMRSRTRGFPITPPGGGGGGLSLRVSCRFRLATSVTAVFFRIMFIVPWAFSKERNMLRLSSRSWLVSIGAGDSQADFSHACSEPNHFAVYTVLKFCAVKGNNFIDTLPGHGERSRRGSRRVAYRVLLPYWATN